MEGTMFSLPGRLDGLLHRHGSILPKGAEKEIPLIKQDLEEIISILHGHNAAAVKLEEHAMVVRCWMKEVRELSFDIEDCVEQYEEYATAAGRYRSGSNYIRHRKLLSRRRRNKQTPWVPEKLKQRLRMANKIREFSLRVQEALQRHGHAICGNDLGGIANTNASTARDDASSRSHSLCREHADSVRHVGLDAAINKVQEWVTDGEKKLKVVSIVGVGGVGKTTLANELYCKLGQQFDCRAFVRSSQKPDMRRFLISMFLQVRPQQPPDNWKLHSLISNIRTHLQDKRYLIILDDLWDTCTWDIINCTLPDGNSCSRIITTTEIEDLALQSCCYDSKHIFKMKPLGEDDSRNLFLSTVFGSHSNCPSEPSEVSYDIVRKCGGLPLAVVTIASLLATQLEKKDQWDYINRTLGYSLMANPNLEGMKQLLNLCYNNLPRHLKACMLYLSMYQENNIIWKDDLVNQWIAEGFICPIEGHEKEEISRAYFNELVGRKIIQPVHINDNGEVLSCVVHHMVLNLITYVSTEENFIIAIDHSHATTRLADKVRRLSIHFGNIEDATPPTNMRLSQVRTLAFCGVLNCMSFIMGFQFLKVLTLHFWGDDDTISFDLTKISELVRLRYLKVTSNVTLKLPTHMQGLQYLETLKIDGKIGAVPSDIIHLPGLLHLSLPAKTNLPNGIDYMSSLRTLGYFDLSCNTTENLWSLGELTNLQDLQLTYSAIHSHNLKNNMQYLGSILGKLCNLRSIILSPAVSSYANSLHIESATRTRISVYGWSSVSSPLALLQRLELLPCVFIFSSLPNWIGQLGNLCILKIGIREVTSNDVDVLGGLLGLTVLSLYVHAKPAERIVFDNVSFSVLKYLKFRCSVAWMKFEAGAMPNLQKLKLGFDVHRADQYDTIPVGIEHLSGLEEISAKIKDGPIVNIRCVDWTFDGKDNSNVRPREEEHLQKQHHIVKEVLNEKSAVLQKDPGEGAHEFVESRERCDELAGGEAMQSEEVRMRFGRCPYCRAMIYQNPKAVIFYCSRCRTPIRGKNPEPTDEAEYALSRLEILSADTASVFSDDPEDVGSDKRVDEPRPPSSRRTRRPSSSSDWTTTTTDSERSEEAFYTPRNGEEGRSWQSPSPMSSQEVGASGAAGVPGPPEPGAVAAARLMDPAFHKELLHALDNLRSLIITIEQPRPASSGNSGGGRAITRRDSRLFRRLESQLERALPPEETASTSASSSGRGGVGRPAATAQEDRDPCRPVLGGTPFVICGKCSELLRTPPPPRRRRRRRRPTRIRCGGCQEVLELSLPAGVPAQHRPIRTCSALLVSDHRPLLRRLE